MKWHHIPCKINSYSVQTGIPYFMNHYRYKVTRYTSVELLALQLKLATAVASSVEKIKFNCFKGISDLQSSVVGCVD